MRKLMCFFVLFASTSPSYSDTYYSNNKANTSNVSVNHNYEKKLTTLDAVKKLKWEIGAVFGGVTYLGIDNWNWGSSNSFKTTDEGWFGTDTHSAGADKLGHMYSSFLINELFTKQLIRKTNNVSESAKKAALFSTGIMLWVEVFDGYSEDHGFSYEDVVFNSAGIGLSYLKNTVPGLDEKLDLRVEYHPTHNSKHWITDYSGYTYLLVTKLGGYDHFRNSPLKYLELQLGYHTEGFKKNDSKHFKEKKAEITFGVGINLSEVLFKPANSYSKNVGFDYADTFFKYYQAPGISLSTPINTRTVPFK